MMYDACGFCAVLTNDSWEFRIRLLIEDEDEILALIQLSLYR